MALTESTMLDLHSPAPDFCLPNTSGGITSLSDFDEDKLLVVLFICNHCPYVIHIAPALSALAKKYQDKGVGFVAINSNDVDTYPADNFDAMKKERELRGYSFPYLLDESQAVAKAYNAACTPDIYVFDASRKLAYRGQFDASRPHRISSGNYDSSKAQASGDALASALDKLLTDGSIEENQIPSMGCNIKWKAGNTPDYFA